MNKLTVPRIAGIILIIIAILSFLLRQEGIILGLAGLVFILAPSDYARKQFDWFTATFSHGRIVLVTFLYDAFSWLLIAEFGFFYLSRARSFISELEANGFKLALKTPALASNAAESVQQLAAFFVAGISLLVMASFAVYVFFRFLSWITVAKQRFSRNLFVKFVGLNVLMWIFWILIIVFLGISLKQNPAIVSVLVLLMIFAAYFTILIHSLFFKTHRIGYSISNGLSIGVGKIHRLLVPFALVISLYIIAFQLFKLIQFLPLGSLQTFVSFIFLILFLAWLRFYLYKIITEIPRSEV